MTCRAIGSAAAALFVLVLVSAGCRAGAARSTGHVDIVAELTPDGVLDVRETFVLQLHGTPPQTFAWQIDADRADVLAFVSASKDGQTLVRDGSGDTRVAVRDGRRLAVTWTFPQPSAGRAVLGLSYRVHGAVAIHGMRGSIRRTLIAPRRGYDISTARIAFAVSEAAQLFDGTGLAEAGWTVSRIPRGIAAERQGLGADDPATLVAEVSVDRALATEPTWQRHAAWAQELVPAFISGGVFILVIGGGILWIVRFQYPKARRLGTAADERERDGVRAGLRTGGLVSITLALGLAAFTWLVLDHLGPWAQALPVSIFVVGAVFALIAKRYV
jgi:hypothetical protein